MFGALHFINPNRYPKSSDLIGGSYPLGLSLDKFLDLFNDAKSISFNGFAIIDSTLAQNIAASSITEGLSNLNGANNSAQSSSFAGISKRKIIPIGQLTSSGEELAASKIPSCLIDYPFHSAGGSGGLMTIDFGFTLVVGGLFYPKINIQFSNGMGSSASGIFVGSISFAGYGDIPIYGGSAVDGINIGFAGGSISVAERYSYLRADSLTASVSSTVRLVATSPMTNLTAYKTAYFGSAKARVEASDKALSITVPENAKSGPIRISSDDPLDTFLTYDEIRIS